LVATLAACVPPTEFIVFSPTTGDPLTRIESGTPLQVLTAGAEAIRQIGFDIATPTSADEGRIFSEPLSIQTVWLGEPVSRRVLCGVGTAVSSDLIRVIELSDAVPVEIQLGLVVERRASGTATSIIFEAQGRRTGAEPQLTMPSMACTLANDFVEELFAAIDARLAGGSQ
jgi:hypothetical protein